MVLADKATYFRRFTVKLVEIVAAGIGTAVSGYLVAYVTGHLSWFTPAAVKPGASAPQAISTPVEPKKTASIEATVRAALASHDDESGATPRRAPVSSVAAMPVTATPMPATPMPATSTPATPVAATPPTEAAPPLATTEIKTVPVAAAASPLPAVEPDGWPSNPAPLSTTGSSRLPPQPPPVNGNLLTALKRFF